jgi:hypothetical protein
MFGLGRGGRDKTASDVAQTAAGTAEPKVGGKGRPTPSRREAERRNYHPVVGGSRLRPGATKTERKAARKARREALGAERALQRQAMYTGDEKHLPPRDRGPARRWARDYVDARRGLGEYFLGFAIIALVMSMIRNPLLQLAATALIWSIMIAVAAESYLLRRRLKQETEKRFGDQAQGAATYGMMRSLQLRRTRMPRPQVDRGQFPS